jgi:hypothetical protein
MNVKLEANQNLTSAAREDEAKDEAHHPCWKIRTENIKRWRMSCHFWRGVTDAEAGLARSPTLSARAAALVWIAERVSTMTLRDAVTLRWAFATST